MFSCREFNFQGWITDIKWEMPVLSSSSPSPPPPLLVHCGITVAYKEI
jgi:hypothetical protein